MTAALRRARWRHPEAVAGLAALAAWTALVWLAAGGGTARRLHAEAHDAAPAAAALAGWMTMTVAMMVPAALPELRRLGLAAMWHRRGRTIALFLAAHLAVWAAYGGVATGAVALARAYGVETAPMLAAALAVAAVWELTPRKGRALRACHLVEPLPPRGARADAACVLAGLAYGRRCVSSCWALMLPMVIAGHGSIALLAALTAVAVAERAAVRAGPIRRPAAAGLFGAALAVALA